MDRTAAQRVGLGTIVALLALALTLPSALAATPGGRPATPADFNRLLTELVRDHLPQNYEDTRHWGMTKKRWDGLHIRRDGWEIKTKRRWKEVNDGAWRRYRITLPEEKNAFAIQVAGARRTSEGKIAVDITTEAELDAFARFSQWEQGVQLISLSADASARVRVDLTLETAVHFDHAQFPPDVVLTPQATQARFKLLKFRVDKVSKIEGPMAHDLGRRLRGTIERKLRSEEADAIEKINRQIVKNEDKLRLSAASFASAQWSKLREQVQTAVDTLP